MGSCDDLDSVIVCAVLFVDLRADSVQLLVWNPAALAWGSLRISRKVDLVRGW